MLTYVTDLNAALFILTSAVFLLAGFVKGIVGLGLPTVSMALLALAMPPAQAAALLIAPSLVTNLWQLRPLVTLSGILKRVAAMQCGIFIGTLFGAWLLGAPAGAWAMIALGCALVCYATWGLMGAEISLRSSTEVWLGPLIGITTGFVTAATGVFVVPAVPYLQALGLKRDELIQAMGISFTTSTVALGVGLTFNAQYSLTAFTGSIVMLLPTLAGIYCGQIIRNRLSREIFSKCFFGALTMLGVHMIAHEFLIR